MIDSAQATQGSIETQRVLKMVKNERMGGFVPKWETIATTKKQTVEQNLSLAEAGQTHESFQNTLAYQATHINTPPEPQEEFGFGDVIDMVNPLHHIPLVGHLYRSVTGDEIKPIGKIIGGAVFGGAVGAASGVVNMIVEEETGKDIASNAVAMVVNGEKPTFKTASAAEANPEQALSNAVKTAEENDFPASLLAFTDLSHKSKFTIEKVSATDERTAGTFVRKTYPKIDPQILTPREPITQIRLREMPE